MCPPNSSQTPRQRSVPKTTKMHFRTKTDRIPRSNTTKRHYPHGSSENPRSGRLAKTYQRHRSSVFPRVHWFLSLLHPELFKNRKTVVGPHQENDRLALGRTTKACVRETQNFDVPTTSVSPTKLRTTVCSPH